MKLALSLIFSTLLLAFATSSHSQDVTFNSGDKQVSLLELYTSQGCSSCPPADEWLGELKNKPGLWTEFVPVAFHVDYWDYIGWKDTFSKQEFSQRQRLHRKQGNVKVVYTPGFFLNGKEWKRRWGHNQPSSSNTKAGNLQAVLSGDTLKVSYNTTKSIENATLNVGVLGFGYQTPINAGENSNRVLIEDFVLLSHTKYSSSNQSWEVNLPEEVMPKAEKYALAIWVSQNNDLKPLQTTGGWLPDSYY